MVWSQLFVLSAVVGYSGAVPQNGPGSQNAPGQQNPANSPAFPGTQSGSQSSGPAQDVTLIASHHQGNWSAADCNFATYRPSSNMPGAAISNRYWFNSRACGGCIQVTDKNTGRSVTAMVVDTCEECESDIALFDDAWQYLAPIDQNTLNVAWEGTSCSHRDPLQIEFTRGVDAGFFSLQVLNANWPVFDVWVRPTGQQNWGKLTARYWNVFEAPDGQGVAQKVDIMVDCSNVGGGQVFVENVPVQGGRRIWANRNC